MTDLSVVIVSFNTKAMLADCLASVFQETEIPFETIVVDNGSCDGSAAMVRRQFPTVRLVELDRNSGFACAANLGAALSTAHYICLLNPDTIVHDHALDRLVEFAESRPELGLYGGRTLQADGSVDPRSCWAKPSLWSMFCYASGLSSIFRRSIVFDRESMGHWNRGEVRSVDVVTGCLMLTRRDVWEELKGFDERFFMYGEDADLSLRAAASGYRPTITPEATITHFVGAASGSRVEKGKLLLAGKITLMEKHWRPIQAVVGRELLLTGIGVRALLSLADRRPSYARQLWAERDIWKRGYARRLPAEQPSLGPRTAVS